MKTITKILLVLILATFVFGVLPQSESLAANPVGALTAVEQNAKDSPTEVTGLASVIGKLLAFLQIASGVVAVLMIAITGFNYIVGTPDVKDEMKKKMLPIIIGLVLVFGAVSIARFILGAVGQN